MEKQKRLKCEIYRDSMQNYKKYAIPPAQLIIADVPYNVGNNFYGSNPQWYNGGDNKNGESKLAGKAAFNSDFNFNLFEYFHFCSKMLKKEDKRKVQRGRSSNSPCMIVFCSYEQQRTLIEAAKKHGFIHYIPLTFIKNYSPQVLKANMRIVGATEHALVLYRDKLPKFRNGAKFDEDGKTIRGTGRMVFDWFAWEKDGKEIPKIHPAQKPVNIIKKLIETFTDDGDVVIDPCCGSGTTLRAAVELGRSAYGFEIDREYFNRAKDEMLKGMITEKREDKRMGIIDNIKRDAGNSGIKIQDSAHRDFEVKLNKLFYLDKDIEKETEFVQHVMTRGQESQERKGLHASAIIVGEDRFCYRQHVLSLFYKQLQGEAVPIGLKRIFEEGNAIHEKWQRLFVRGGYALPEDCDKTVLDEEYDLQYTPDIICNIDGVKYVGEIKSVNTGAFKKLVSEQKDHESGKKQLMLYMHLTGIKKGFVLCEDKNTQDFYVRVYDYDYELVKPYIERLMMIQAYKNKLEDEHKLVKRHALCNGYSSDMACKCPMREVCYGKNKERL